MQGLIALAASVMLFINFYFLEDQIVAIKERLIRSSSLEVAVGTHAKFDLGDPA